MPSWVMAGDVVLTGRDPTLTSNPGGCPGHCRLLSLAHVGRSWEIQTKRCYLHVTLPVLLISISLQGFGLRSWFGMGAVELPAT